MLHDTYGFPIDLTRIMAEERGIEGRHRRLRKVNGSGRRNLARLRREKAVDAMCWLILSPAALVAARKHPAPIRTDDSAKYQNESIQATVIAIWDGQELGLITRDCC